MDRHQRISLEQASQRLRCWNNHTLLDEFRAVKAWIPISKMLVLDSAAAGAAGKSQFTKLLEKASGPCFSTQQAAFHFLKSILWRLRREQFVAGDVFRIVRKIVSG